MIRKNLGNNRKKHSSQSKNSSFQSPILRMSLACLWKRRDKVYTNIGGKLEYWRTILGMWTKARSHGAW